MVNYFVLFILIYRKMSWTGRILSSVVSRLPQVTQVRHRYFKEMREKGPVIRRYGIHEQINMRGLLPRESEDKLRSLPLYKPKPAWSERRALFGQNDYIDILGDDNLHPTKILYKTPAWLRGVKGNEYQVLLRKEKIWSKGIMPHARPKRWKDIKQRIKYLYTYLNRKTKTGMKFRS